MRRLPSLAVLAAGGLVVSLSLPLGPAAAAQVSRVVFQGEVAVGEWSTCPQPQLGDRCLFTRVIAGDSTTRELLGGHGAHPTMAGPSLVLQHTWYDVAELDGELVQVPWREGAGGVGVPGFPGGAGNPTARFDTRLRGGTATATDLRMALSDESTGWETVWRSVSVQTSWHGSGLLEAVREGSIFHTTSRLTSHSSTSGWLRPATATGGDSLSGSWGTFLGGVLYHVTQREATAYRGRVPQSQGTAPPSQGAAAAVAVLRGLAPVSSSSVLRYRLSSSYGDAFWTTCPVPAAGDRCRDTFLGYSATVQPGGSPERFAFLQVMDYRVRAVEDGWVDLELLAVVTAKVPATSLVAPADLSGAAVVVTDAPAELCVGELACTQALVSFQGTWQGTGTAQRFAQHGVAWGDWGREWVHLAGRSRTAVATASVSGLPSGLGLDGAVPGRTVSAAVASSTERHQYRPSGRTR